MPTIEEDKYYVVLVELEVEPKQQQDFIDAIGEQIERHIKHFPGFVSASFHASEDGKRVYNYAQWRSREDYESFLAIDPEEPRKVFELYTKSLTRTNASMANSRRLGSRSRWQDFSANLSHRTHRFAGFSAGQRATCRAFRR